MNYIKFFKEITINDIPLVGGKNASLGQMISSLSDKNIKVPDGFAITSKAYWHFLDSNNLVDHVKELVDSITDYSNMAAVTHKSVQIRSVIEYGKMPADLEEEILTAYKMLSKEYGKKNIAVAVRSSATAEDLPTASFAGQQESFLNVTGDDHLIKACKECFSSLFTPRAIIYRQEKGFDHFKVALSIGVQKMVRADKGSSGVAFSLDTESGFKDVIVINASYGLGEAIVQGMVTPDEFVVHKPTLQRGYKSIIKKKLGDKKVKIIYAKKSNTMQAKVPAKDQLQFCLPDDDVMQLAHAVMTIEQLYSELKGSWCPMDVEWAKDGIDHQLYIIQARPETIYGAQENRQSFKRYTLKPDHSLKVVVQGQSIGQHIVSGTVKIIESAKQIDAVKAGDILITRMTDPDWVPALKKASGIITEQGGRTCHAAIVSRELSIPAIVGAQHALKLLHDGQKITLDCSQGSIGYVYEGEIPFDTTMIVLDEIPKAPVAVMMNLADPDRAFALSALPVDGIGLARIEFIINNSIKIHPMALLHPELITEKKIKKKIEEITASYHDKKQFFIDSLAQGIALIAAAFWPKPVIVRTSDFKTNEYRNLIGGTYFEPEEENPMIGFRGAMRYYSDRYKAAFALECAALKKVRQEMGLANVKVMIPFVRTLDEAHKVLHEMAQHDLHRGQHELQVIMMCEIPSNVVLIDEFLEYFDGISIGSNDLTQLTLGIDRDSPYTSGLFDERDAAMKKMFALAVEGAKRHNKYSGICGQAPSDYPEIGDYLIKIGIESLSLNPDSVIPFLMRFK